ncbi:MULTISPECIES: hypothetical protein [Rhizobium/Agrobacterium group]|uniref:hypothetical protein n=1 Tax=Rhizobium/Agrobacterium group TaxID=227290 RepID=UPI002300B3F8|nr:MULTISPECIES: hypothetical protein [Rhizobium/Agrobacterium group]MDF1888285.1 hypothetical protein [Rhizobium rhizogenes]
MKWDWNFRGGNAQARYAQCENTPASVIPALSRNPASPSPWAEKSCPAAPTRVDWIPAQGRNDGREMSRTDENVEVAQALRFCVFEGRATQSLNELNIFSHHREPNAFGRVVPKQLGATFFR